VIQVDVVDNNVVYPITGDEDLAAAGLPTENDNDITEDAAALVGINMNGAGGAEPMATATGTQWSPTPTALMVLVLQLLLWVSASLLYGMILMRSRRM
jgi:hypothetical protein